MAAQLMPAPGRLTRLGTCLAVADAGGRLYAEGKPLYWSPRLRALIIGPRTGTWSQTSGPQRSRAARTLQRWTDGRKTGASVAVARTPAVPMRCLGRCSWTFYRSSKWGHCQGYKHPHGPGVKLYHDPQTGLTMVRGGKLRITREGIEG